MELFQAHRQWAKRPNDERFQTSQALYDACLGYARTAVEVDDVRIDSLRVEAHDGDIRLVGKGNEPARLTNWSAGQLAERVGAPISYIQTLPATLAAQNLNYGLAKRVAANGEATASLMFHRNGDFLLRAMNGKKYSRLWNFEVASRLVEMEMDGWRPATPDIRKIDDRLPLYASDHDMFAFIMHPEYVLREPGNPEGLRRGMIVSNSEVGAGKLLFIYFLYRAMCGNHIIWGAENVVELGAIHVGNIAGKFAEWQIEIKKYLDASPLEEEARIAAVMTKRIAKDKDELLDLLFGRRSLNLTRKALEAGYAAVQDEDGDPLTAWGIAQGLTRYSQTTPYADERMKIDKAAGRILDASF